MFRSCHIIIRELCSLLKLYYLLTYLLTYSKVQSPSWKANWFGASQEIPRISRNPKVHYRTHKRPPPSSILGQPNPVHIPTSHLLQIHPNIIHPSTPRSPQWSPSLRFPHQDPIHPPLRTHTRHMPSPSHSSKVILQYSQFNSYLQTRCCGSISCCVGMCCGAVARCASTHT